MDTIKNVGDEIQAVGGTETRKVGSMEAVTMAQEKTTVEIEVEAEAEAGGSSVDVALLNLGDFVTIMLLPEPENGGKVNRYGLATWVARGGAVRMLAQVL
jgi:hypothetical protein